MRSKGGFTNTTHGLALRCVALRCVQTRRTRWDASTQRVVTRELINFDASDATQGRASYCEPALSGGVAALSRCGFRSVRYLEVI